MAHPLLDEMTIYGTRLALPFSERPFVVGRVFSIDLPYMLPQIAGAGWAWRRAARHSQPIGRLDLTVVANGIAARG